MKHHIKKIKFTSGQDANQSLVKKLVYNFFRDGKLETTMAKAKVLKTLIDTLVPKTKVYSEANKNVLLSYIHHSDVVARLFKEVGPAMKDINGGYVRITRLNQRQSDAALMGRVEWAHPLTSVSPVAKEEVAAAPVEVAKAEETVKPKRRTTKKAVETDNS